MASRVTESMTSRTQQIMEDVASCLQDLIELKPHSVFYRMLVHPGITVVDLRTFLGPIVQLARIVTEIEIVAFFDDLKRRATETSVHA